MNNQIQVPLNAFLVPTPRSMNFGFRSFCHLLDLVKKLLGLMENSAWHLIKACNIKAL